MTILQILLVWLILDCKYEKEVVVSHDKHIERITGDKQNVNELNYSEIKHYLPEVELEFTESKSFIKIKNNSEYYIPKFEVT